jgi:hypothetical protein
MTAASGRKPRPATGKNTYPPSRTLCFKITLSLTVFAPKALKNGDCDHTPTAVFDGFGARYYMRGFQIDFPRSSRVRCGGWGYPPTSAVPDARETKSMQIQGRDVHNDSLQFLANFVLWVWAYGDGLLVLVLPLVWQTVNVSASLRQPSNQI